MRVRLGGGGAQADAHAREEELLAELEAQRGAVVLDPCAVEVGQEQQMSPAGLPMDFGRDFQRGCVIAAARSVMTTQREIPYLSGVPAC